MEALSFLSGRATDARRHRFRYVGAVDVNASPRWDGRAMPGTADDIIVIECIKRVIASKNHRDVADGRPGPAHASSAQRRSGLRAACSWCCAVATGLSCCPRYERPTARWLGCAQPVRLLVDEATADAYMRVRCSSIPDVWVLEFEAPDAPHSTRSWCDQSCNRRGLDPATHAPSTVGGPPGQARPRE